MCALAVACCIMTPPRIQGLSRPKRVLQLEQRYTQSLVESQQKGKRNSGQQPKKHSIPDEKYVMKPDSCRNSRAQQNWQRHPDDSLHLNNDVA